MTVLIRDQLPTTPRPSIDPEVAAYWDAAESGVLTVPHCAACDRNFWYPRGFCPRCSSGEVEFRVASGLGVIYSYTVVRRSFGEWKDHAPFVLAAVALSEGVTLTANVVNVDLAELRIGMPVTAIFEKSSPDDLPALRFRPVQAPVAGTA